ncbi:hypothetical protein MN086_05830 [Sulfurovum sp. XGS-02]|uniref:hypothetical protein n=1 Tax=Sulfurovum sp. XGS-02 TaxID=2925411 RepID=UPI0020550A27|nr:hypothetical protein [Sulfurovum sp. XGS-02]UPT76572.1 hypothetical protein MN086_05830 [Sulfurovum sp. XGS-02]
MKCKYLLPTLCIFGTMSLHAEQKGLGNILQEAGQKKALTKPEPQKKPSKNKKRFIFKDEYKSNDIESGNKAVAEKKSESYDYDNRSRFKFKFNDGSAQGNFMSGYGGNAGMGGSMGGGAGQGGGSGGGGRR